MSTWRRTCCSIFYATDNREKISDFHVFRAQIKNMSEKVATKFRLWASLLVSAEYWNRETIKRVRREVEGQTSEIKEQGITEKKREWMEWVGQIRLNMLAIKLHKDLFFTSIYTHTYRSTVVALLLHHIYINIQSDDMCAALEAIYRDCATKQEGAWDLLPPTCLRGQIWWYCWCKEGKLTCLIRKEISWK